MVELLPYAELFSVLQILIVFLVGAILFFTLKAYRMTSYSFLIPFFIGFTLLEISFTFVLLNRLFGQTGIFYHGTLWVHEIIQVGAFAFIASTYYFRNKNLTVRSITAMTIVFVVVLFLAFYSYLSFPSDIAFEWREVIGLYLYAISLGVSVYLLYNVFMAFTRTSEKSYPALLIPAGFLMLVISQVLWVYWGITDIGMVLVLANSLLALSLGTLTLAIAIIWRR
jgi:hypothetical protein